MLDEDQDSSSNVYAAPGASGASTRPPIPWRGVAAVWFAVVLSALWAIYGDFMLNGQLGIRSWYVATVTFVVWAVFTAPVLLRVSWGRGLLRVVALLAVIRAIFAIAAGGSTDYYIVAFIRQAAFAAAVMLLRPPHAAAGEADELD